MKTLLHRLHNDRFQLVAIILIAVGIVVRFYVVLNAGSWWFDESVSQAFAKIPLLQSWHYLKYENNPPLYYWFLHGWGLLFGFHEISLRLFSVLIGVLALFAIMQLGKELFDEKVGLWAGAIYAIASFAIFLDSEARMYSLLGLFIALSYYYFLKILFKQPTRWEIALFVIVSTLALYTNITALWIPLAQGLILAFIKPKEVSRLKAGISILVPVLLFSPWLIAFALERISFAQYIPGSNWWYFGNMVPFLTLFFEPATFFNFWSVAIGWVDAISFVGSISLIGWFLYGVWKRWSNPAAAKFIVLMIGLMLPLVLSSILIPFSSPRYFLQSAIFFWIIMAYGIVKLSSRMTSKLALAVLIAGIVGYAIFNISFGMAYASHGNWDAAAQWIDAQHADMVLAMPKLWAANVYTTSTPFYYLLPPVDSLEHASPLSPLQIVTRYNYNWGSVSFVLTQAQKNILSTEIDNATATSSKIIFGYEGGATQETILGDLRALGFRRENEFQVYGYDSETIAVFDRVAY